MLGFPEACYVAPEWTLPLLYMQDGRVRLTRIMVGTVVTLALASLAGRALLEVARGHGGHTYANALGMQIHWVTVLALAAAMLVALVLALAMRWWQRRDDRTIDRLLKARRDDTSRPRDNQADSS